MALSSYLRTEARSLVKSRSNGRLIAAATDFISAHFEAIVIAPTHSAGEELAYLMPGRAGLHRMTLVQLATDLARPSMAGMGLSPLTSLGLEALSARVVYSARVEKDLSYFAPVSALPGFARAVARTLGELRMAGVGPGEIAASGGPGADLSGLLSRYETELEEQSLADLARVFKLAAQAAAEKSHRWTKLPLLWLDVPLESPIHREFLALLAAHSPSVFAAVSSDENVFADILGVAAHDLDTAAPGSSLERLRTYLFFDAPPVAEDGDARFDLFSAPAEGLEAVEIARRIVRMARDGKTFDRIAILLHATARYQPVLEDALSRARIPAYFSRGTARPDPSGRAFLALLGCAAEKCSASRFAEYLSLGQVPPAGFESGTDWVAATDEMLTSAAAGDLPAAEVDETLVPRAPAAWERLLVDAAVIGGRDRWQRRLHGLEREIELRMETLEREDDPRRDHLAQRLDQLRQLERFALPLIDELHALPSTAHWGEWIERLTRLSNLALRRPEPVLAVLAELVPMSDVGPATLEEIAEALSERLRFLRNDPPHRRYGRVFVGSIEESRGREFDVVFLPGLAEGLFPQRALEDPLLLDDFRREIAKSLRLRDDRVDQERSRLRWAVGAARECLIASYPRMDLAEVRPRVPSFYALELPRAVEGRLTELKEFERRAREAAPARLNWPAPRDIPNAPDDAIDDFEYDLVMLDRALATGHGARYLVEANPHLARSLRARWKRWSPKWTESDGLVTKDPDALAVLATQRLSVRAWSPSSLQQFAVCPYKFALSGIYGLRPRDEAAPLEQMDPLTRGALFHAVQFALLGELRTRSLLPVNPERLAKILKIADSVLDEVAAKYQDDLVPAIPRVWSSEIEDLRTDLRGWLQHIAVNDGEWQPIHFEFAFGLPAAEGRDPASTGEEVRLKEGSVRLRGSIDLVERHATRSQILRVTDHKTGKMPECIPAYVGGGRFLQPLLYGLAAEKLLGATVESGRLFYATQQGGYNPIEIRLVDKTRQFLGKLLDNIDHAIETGFLPPAPQKDACEMCDYRIVCGPYEELRFASHKNRRDERLEPLTEIRGMA